MNERRIYLSKSIYDEVHFTAAAAAAAGGVQPSEERSSNRRPASSRWGKNRSKPKLGLLKSNAISLSSANWQSGEWRNGKQK